jgi:hypothetical protein
MVWILKAVYFLCPILAIRSVIWYFVSDVGVWAFFLFLVFGFVGMFAGSAAKQMEDRKRSTFTFRADDPTSIARAAFFEIEGKDEIPGLSQIKDDVLSLLNDSERTTASMVDDKIAPRGLIYLLVCLLRTALCMKRRFYFATFALPLLQTFREPAYFLNRAHHLLSSATHPSQADTRELAFARASCLCTCLA